MSTRTQLSPKGKTPTKGRLRANRLFAAAWDWMSSHESKATREMRQKVVSSASGRVLEIGCGTGASFPYYSRDVQVMATEPDKYMLKRARRHLDERGLTNIELHRTAAEDIPFEDASFDTVVTCWVFCHIGDNAPHALLAGC
jgi:ubiquinone/menaquinone biosynthesis C-methylase UbiE